MVRRLTYAYSPEHANAEEIRVQVEHLASLLSEGGSLVIPSDCPQFV